MIKEIIISTFILFLTGPVFTQTDESFWSNRTSGSNECKKSYEYYRDIFTQEKNYENAWKFARIAYYYADNFVNEPEKKKAVFTQSKDASEIATNLFPGGVEGHYYLAISIGSWAQANGVLESLSAVDKIIKEATKVIEIDPYFQNADGYTIRARVYHLAPPVISAGDTGKAILDYEKAIIYGPGNRTAFRFYAELLMDTDRKKAKDIIERGLGIPIDRDNERSDMEEIENLKKLQARLRN
ncbi:MAG: tetratricopeptide repeat protein [Brevinematales bacterium]|jgi:tetratricopeptide (TPR) repeat protein